MGNSVLLADASSGASDLSVLMAFVRDGFRSFGYSARSVQAAVRPELVRLVELLRERSFDGSMAAKLAQASGPYDFFFLLAENAEESDCGRELAELVEQYATMLDRGGFRLPGSWFDVRKLREFPQ